MIKRLFDVIFSLILIILISFIILIGFILASIDNASNGFFTQKRVGQYGRLFTIYKLKTIHPVTREISSIGRFLRKCKIDELPQLFNVLIGDMSFVGPRPDIEGYYDKLEGEERIILDLKPGLTSLASIKYSKEEQLLSKQENPLKYNDEVIFPDKVKMNMEYYHNRSFFGDVKIIIQTVMSLIN